MLQSAQSLEAKQIAADILLKEVGVQPCWDLQALLLTGPICSRSMGGKFL